MSKNEQVSGKPIELKSIDWENLGKNIGELLAWIITIGLSTTITTAIFMEILTDLEAYLSEENLIYAIVLFAPYGIFAYIELGKHRPIKKDLSSQN